MIKKEILKAFKNISNASKDQKFTDWMQKNLYLLGDDYDINTLNYFTNNVRKDLTFLQFSLIQYLNNKDKYNFK